MPFLRRVPKTNLLILLSSKLLFPLLVCPSHWAQTNEKPTFRAGKLLERIQLNGYLDEFELELKRNPSHLVGFELTGLRNVGRLPFGDFEQTLAGLRVRFNVSSNLQLNSYAQYDTDSRVLGINARIH